MPYTKIDLFSDIFGPQSIYAFYHVVPQKRKIVTSTRIPWAHADMLLHARVKPLFLQETSCIDSGSLHFVVVNHSPFCTYRK